MMNKVSILLTEDVCLDIEEEISESFRKNTDTE